jgi:predicted Zn-dependent protease
LNATAAAVGSLEVALTHARRLLEQRPALALEQAEEILKTAPGHPLALLVQGSAQRLLGNTPVALAILEPLAHTQPRAAAAQCEYGLALGAAGRGESAVAALQRALALDSDMAPAWRALADHLDATGDQAGAATARAHGLRLSVKDPRLLAAAAALCENRIPDAEGLLRRHLNEFPTDIAALRMFAEVAARVGRLRDAQHLLERCLELAPTFHAARHNYAVVLFRQAQAAEALPHIDRLLALEPHNPSYRSLKAAILTGVGEFEAAIALYGEVLAEYPQQPKIWLSYGHALKTAGRRDEAITAYRRTLDLEPSCGEAYWSLANLKTLRFAVAEVSAMRSQLAREGLKAEDRYHLHFALGKALEDAREYHASFEHYLEGNTLRRAELNYDPAVTREHVARSRALFTREFLAAHADSGCAAPDPIFIVGLPRAGSTLLEQILSSHSQVEGTMELADLTTLARTLASSGPGKPQRYPEALASLDAHELRALGERYLERTRVQRKSSAPFFIDKMPNNFEHVGLIHLILPRARIIDARRHPLGCCFSAFKQHFARGQGFTYDLGELGAYYRDYVELLAHFDAVLPDRILRVHYERLVEDTESEVRRVLDYCGLEFEPACLRFFENERAVRTASSEQVRTPIFREALEQYRHYEPWLAPLKAALGLVLDAYPNVPSFDHLDISS